MVGVIALAAAIYSLTMKLKKEEISSHFGDIAISFEEINELVGPITEELTDLFYNIADQLCKRVALEREVYLVNYIAVFSRRYRRISGISPSLLRK